MKLSFAQEITDTVNATPRIMISLKVQNHSLTCVLIFWGYMYCLFIVSPYFFAIALPRLIAVVVVWTTLIILNLILVSRPYCCAILGTSLADNITPKPIKGWSGIVIKPRSNKVVCINVVKQSAIICLHQPVNPSVYPLGKLNIWRLPTAIWVKRIPPRLTLAKKHLITQYPRHIKRSNPSKGLTVKR